MVLETNPFPFALRYGIGIFLIWNNIFSILEWYLEINYMYFNAWKNFNRNTLICFFTN